MYICHERWRLCRLILFFFPIYACLSKSFTNAMQGLLEILQNISSLYNFPDDHTLFLFPLSNARKRFQCSSNSLLKELHHIERYEEKLLKMSCSRELRAAALSNSFVLKVFDRVWPSHPTMFTS